MNRNIRNIAIIAHVDHGKTTLVDALLRQSGVFRENQQVADCVMDSLDLERERGITILAKNTAVEYRGIKINIVDTPGHADFSGEVERVLGMVDGALLIVDAFEGPMPQTRYVLRKALEQGIKPIVVVNKIDRPGCRPVEVVDLVLDLFIDLGADDDQIEFPVVFASGINGTSTHDLATEGSDMRPLFESILKHVPAPAGDSYRPLQLQVTTLDYSEYLGRVVIGRIHHGQIAAGQPCALLRSDGTTQKGKVTKLFTFSGLKRLETEKASAGDLVAVAGFPDANIGDTIADAEDPNALPLIKVDEPTLQMTFSINDSPFAGREGKYVTSRHLRDRLQRELLSNVALRVEETDSPDRFLVSGRGELHLGILVETMRREGYEFQISKPRVILKTIGGQVYEPYELLTLDVPDEYAGTAIEALGRRRGELHRMESDGSRTQLEFLVPARGLLGFRGDFIRMTRGNGTMNHSFFEYKPFAGDIGSQRNGVLVAWEEGEATAYALSNLEDRGVFFIKPGVKVYTGMIVGEHTRQQDLEINVCKAKKLTNMRAASGEELVRLHTPIDMTLERAMEYINDDELIEVTPQSVRLRKQKLARSH
ncbi:MAG: translational GTPase TypA [Candidatus Sericytochromatia bacterium]|nr:translational GTPase TypA [Candidatus Tanganyikabacteria bacterium]